MNNIDVYKKTCQTTSLFREPNLKQLISLLKDSTDGVNNSEKAILVIGASVEELVSLWVYASRQGLHNYQFIGINNDSKQVQRSESYLERYRVGTWLSAWERSGNTIYNDLQLGILEKEFPNDHFDQDYKLSSRAMSQIKMIELDAFLHLQNPSVLFEAAVCNNLLVHFDASERDQLIKNIIMHLKPNGIFVRDRGDNGYAVELDGGRINLEIENQIRSQFNDLQRVTDNDGINIYQYSPK